MRRRKGFTYGSAQGSKDWGCRWWRSFWGLKTQADVLHAYREMVSEPDLGVRDGWVRQINTFREDHRLEKKAEWSEEMEANRKSYWEVVQEHHFKRLLGVLAMELVEIGGRVRDATAFKEAYDMEEKDFMMR